MSIVLASTSQTRSRILAAAGVSHKSADPGLDEAPLRTALQDQGDSARDIAKALARAKALALSPSMPGQLIVGADQILIQNGELFAKPQSLPDAARQLRALRGRSHVLISAAALVRDGEVLAEPCAQTRLTMRNFSDAFLAAYLREEGDAILGCVGCYHLEGLGAQLFATIEGDYFTVLGLPLIALLASLRELGMLAT
jgi:septum formation protein